MLAASIQITERLCLALRIHFNYHCFSFVWPSLSSVVVFMERTEPELTIRENEKDVVHQELLGEGGYGEVHKARSSQYTR